MRCDSVSEARSRSREDITMRRNKQRALDWLWTAQSECSPGEPSSSDVLTENFHRLPRSAQEELRRRLLDDCLRTLAASHGLLGHSCAVWLNVSWDERHVLEQMSHALLITVAPESVQ